MRVSSHLIWAAGAVILLMSGAARAQSGPEKDPHPLFGVRMICDTREQAEQFIDLLVQGKEPKQALAIVNEPTQVPHACGFAAIAFIRLETLESKTVRDQLVQVVRVNVLAGFTGTKWRQTPGMTPQYAVMEADGKPM